MKCLDDCHTYDLDYFFGLAPVTILRIHFYEMREDGTKIDGVTNEEVLRTLIHRMEALNKKMSCFENVQAITSLKGALSWLESRTEQRLKRGVEGTHKP
jgi:hypothetical protein